MNHKKSFNEIIKTEIIKLKKMSLKDKLWYIKEYYGVSILISIISLILCFSLIVNVLKKKPVFNVVFLNRPLTETSHTEIYEEFYSYANFSKTNDDWDLLSNINIIIKDNKILSGGEYMAKVNAMIAGQLLDVAITDKFFVNNFASQDILINLEKTLPSDLIEVVKNDFFSTTNKERQSYNFAIDVSNAPVIKKHLNINAPIYFIIFSNSKHMETSIQFLKYLYGV